MKTKPSPRKLTDQQGETLSAPMAESQFSYTMSPAQISTQNDFLTQPPDVLLASSPLKQSPIKIKTFEKVSSTKESYQTTTLANISESDSTQISSPAEDPSKDSSQLSIHLGLDSQFPPTTQIDQLSLSINPEQSIEESVIPVLMSESSPKRSKAKRIICFEEDTLIDDEPKELKELLAAIDGIPGWAMRSGVCPDENEMAAICMIKREDADVHVNEMMIRRAKMSKAQGSSNSLEEIKIELDSVLDTLASRCVVDEPSSELLRMALLRLEDMTDEDDVPSGMLTSDRDLLDYLIELTGKIRRLGEECSTRKSWKRLAKLLHSEVKRETTMSRSKSLLDRHESAECIPWDTQENDAPQNSSPKNLPSKQARRKWTPEEELNLLEGVKRCGKNWALILSKYQFNNRTNVNLKDKYRTLKEAGLIE